MEGGGGGEPSTYVTEVGCTKCGKEDGLLALSPSAMLLDEGDCSTERGEGGPGKGFVRRRERRGLEKGSKWERERRRRIMCKLCRRHRLSAPPSR